MKALSAARNHNHPAFLTHEEVRAWSMRLCEEIEPGYTERRDARLAEHMRRKWAEGWYRAPMDRYLAQLGDA